MTAAGVRLDISSAGRVEPDLEFVSSSGFVVEFSLSHH
ncbi:hypothetical protein ACVWY2_006432 [Bradyrhizobium sp. JR6.1]